MSRPVYLLLLLALPGLSLAQTTPPALPDSVANAPDSVRCRAWRTLGQQLVDAGNMADARRAYQQALTLAQASRSPFDIGMGYREMGYWHAEAGDFATAIGFYQKAQPLFSQLGNYRQLCKNYHHIGTSYNRLDDSPNARKYLRRGLDLARQHAPDQQVRFYGELSILEKKQKNYPAALAYNQQCLDEATRLRDTSQYHVYLIDRALALKATGRYAEAGRILRRVIAFGRATKFYPMITVSEVNLINVLVPLGKLDEAEQLCRDNLARVARTGYQKFVMQQELYGLLSQIAEQRGQYQQALTYHKQQATAHDSVFSETKARQLTELETRYQTREQDAKIQHLTEITAQKDRQLWLGGGGLGLLTLLLGGLFGQYRSIGRKRAKIQRQADQLTLLMRELHHRVKNNLAIVSSLLRLQIKRLDDPQAIRAVQVSQQRVQAMALIHQRLYQTDNVSAVNMREFLTDLAQNLMQAYGYQPDTFDLHLAIEQPEVDVDVAIPLGLIANELITNAFKYAYADVQRPVLAVNLRADNGLVLEVADNGPGLTTAEWQAQTGRSSSFGKRLIATLSEQLDGTLELIRQPGMLFRLHIPQTRLQPLG